MTRKSLEYAEGDLFAIPLVNSGYGVVLVARRVNDGSGPGLDNILCYGFDRVYDNMPRHEEVADLGIFDAVLVQLSVDAMIQRGRWKRIGTYPRFRREGWPVPPEVVPILTLEPRARLCEDPERKRIIVYEDRYLREVNLPREDFVDFERAKLLPLMTGLGMGDSLETFLDRAIWQRDPRHYIKITRRTIGTWHEIVERVKAAGLYPRSRPWPGASRRGKPRPSTRTSGPSKHPADLWKGIDRCRRKAGTSATTFVAALRQELQRHSGSQVVRFQRDLVRRLKEANRWDLWAAAYIMNGGSSDDGFLYFRAWLIAQGQKIYEAAVKDPDSLAGAKLRYGKPGEFELEELLYIAEEALEAQSLEDAPELPEIEPGNPRGKRWDIEDDAQLEDRLPRLWRKYRK